MHVQRNWGSDPGPVVKIIVPNSAIAGQTEGIVETTVFEVEGGSGGTGFGGNFVTAIKTILRTANSNLKFITGVLQNGDEQFSIRGNGDAYFAGNVGIGTTNPLTRLSITSSTNEAKITLWDGGNGSNHLGFGVSSAQLNYHVNGNGSSHVFYAGGKNADGTELMRIRGNGNVGIGTTNPTQLLSLGPDGAGFPTPSGAAPLYACRAWVNFNGTGTPSIRASGNVSSLTRNGTGDYRVNFVTAMPNANYCCVSGQQTSIGSPAAVALQIGFRNYNTARIDVTIDNSGNGSFVDKDLLNIAIFL